MRHCGQTAVQGEREGGRGDGFPERISAEISRIVMDEFVLLFLQDSVRNPVLTPLFTLITTLGNGGMVWILFSAALLFFPRTRKVGIASLLALLFSLLINNIILKNLVGRIRPYETIEGLIPLVARPADYSFPSGHTGSSFAAAWVMYRKLPRRLGIPALILAGLIGISRLYVGVHYPTDVLFGAVCGMISGWIAIRLTENFAKKDFCNKDREDRLEE